jgi:hypothetical protein
VALDTGVLLDNDFTQATGGGAGQTSPNQSQISLPSTISPVGQNVITAPSEAAARNAITAAKSGANSDITSLSALTLAVINDLNVIGYTTSAADPSLTEYPNAGDFGVHKNTMSGDVFAAFNDGGSIVKVQLT